MDRKPPTPRQSSRPLFLSRTLLAGVVNAALACNSAAATLFVDWRQTNQPPDGSTWAAAFPAVQSAVDAAGIGDEIWVASGTYPENVTVARPLGLYGGFRGDEVSLGLRDWSTHLTILDGRTSNSVLRVEAGITAGVRIDGFVIQNGRAASGGGILVETSSSAHIANSLIRSNRTFGTAMPGGGGIGLNSGTVVISNNTFRANVGEAQTSWGGAIGARNGTATVVRNIFTGNRGGFGGAIFLTLSAGLIRENLFYANEALRYGGAIESNSSSPEVANNRFLGNVSSLLGGAFSCSDRLASPRIVNNLFQSNIASGQTGDGAAISCASGAAATIVNNTLIGNRCRGSGGLLITTTNHVLAANNLVAFNSGGIRAGTLTTLSNNCVFSNNNRNYTSVPDPTGTNGNISVDPLLDVDGTIPGWHLTSDSPCRDAGEAAFLSPTDRDLDNELRVDGPAVDIGADEFGLNVPPAPFRIIRVKPTGDDQLDGSTWSLAMHSPQAALDALGTVPGEVWVAGGTYTGIFRLRPFARLYGGFAGTESSLGARAPRTYETILDGQQQGIVVDASSVAETSGIDGFSIRNGRGRLSGGVLCQSSWARITGNHIHSNTGTNSAGGIMCDTGAPEITGNRVIGNTGLRTGGIAVAGGATPQISRNEIRLNLTEIAGGGGLQVSFGVATVRDNIFEANTTPGGGVGGLAILCESGSLGTRLLNNTIVRHLEPGTNAAIRLRAPGILVANNLLASNTAGIESQTNVTAINNLFHAQGLFDLQLLSGQAVATNNLAADPLFVDPSGDFHLQPGSPAIDAGDISVTLPVGVDLDGNPRLGGTAVDIGAYERPAPVLGPSLSIQREGAAQVRVRLDGPPATRHLIERSDEFSPWTRVGISTTLPLEVIEPLVPPPATRLYRARSEP